MEMYKLMRDNKQMDTFGYDDTVDIYFLSPITTYTFLKVSNSQRVTWPEERLGLTLTIV